MSVDDTIDFDDLENEIERILACYKTNNDPLSIEDLTECAKSIIETNTIIFDPQIDHLCLIVDRDCKSFKEDQYDKVIKICNENHIDLYVTNPCFPIEVKSGKKYSIESLKRFKEKYKARIGECYVIHPRNLSFKDDIICIPPYMTICL